MRLILTLLVTLLMTGAVFADELRDVDVLFPSVDELPGGRSHWIGTTAPVEKMNGCDVYSATYVYYTKNAKPLFDIPRKDMYGVNIRFHVCDSVNTAAELYEQFSEVGEAERKRYISLGEKSVLYVAPTDDDPLMGDYYVTSLSRYIVMQVHSDDGFVMMDISEMMNKRLERFLQIEDRSIRNGLTLSITKEGYRSTSRMITFIEREVSRIHLSGIVYDENNKRVGGAHIRILETGDEVTTNAQGEFSINLDAGEGNEISIFRAIEVLTSTVKETALPDGYYRVDIQYSQSGNLGQDVWKLWVDNEGKINGTTMNIRDEKMFTVSGTLNGDTLNLTRPCGTSFMGVCRQQFSGIREDGIFTGTWTGTGGGGLWKLYTDSYADKSVLLRLSEAGYRAVQSPVAGRWPIASGQSPRYMDIKPFEQKHEDYYLVAARLLVDAVADQEVMKPIYLYGEDKNGELQVIGATYPLYISDSSAQGAIDITGLYREATYDTYKIGFNKNDEDNVQASITAKVELVVAASQSKAVSTGAVKARFITFEGEDVAANSKPIKPDGKPDIVLQADISAFGSTLRDVEIISKGRENRRWNTYMSSPYPGVGVRAGNEIVNSQMGAVNYPFEKIEETLLFYVDKGSLNPGNVESFELILKIDEDTITVNMPVMR